MATSNSSSGLTHASRHIGVIALTVRDDSMTAPKGSPRSYPKGCHIIVDPAREASPGDRVVVNLGRRESVFGQLERDGGGQQRLVKLNPAYEPVALPEGAKVLGVVVQTQIDEVDV